MGEGTYVCDMRQTVRMCGERSMCREDVMQTTCKVILALSELICAPAKKHKYPILSVCR